MTEVIASAVVPAASTPERGREVANFIRGRMGHNSERENKKTGSTHYVEQVSFFLLGGVVGVYVCTAVCVFTKLQMTTQPDPAKLFFLLRILYMGDHRSRKSWIRRKKWVLKTL